MQKLKDADHMSDLIRPEKAVENQKVFITLYGFQRLLAEYNRAASQWHMRNFEPTKLDDFNRGIRTGILEGFNLAIAALSLPIELTQSLDL